MTRPPDRRETAARRRVLADHRDTLTAVAAAADRVAAGWESRRASDGSAVAGPLAAELDAAELDEPLVTALVDAVDAAGYELRADPVAAPPYLAVTSLGPVTRATVEDGRLVVAVRVFRVERTPEGPRYARNDAPPEETLAVEVRGADRR